MARLKSELNFAITAVRAFGVQLRTPISDPSMLHQFKATQTKDTFYVMGPGGSLNDLTADHLARIQAGTSISINLAVLAPIDFDFCAQEAVHAQSDLEVIQAALRAKSNPVIWFQNREKYNNDWMKTLEREFDFYRYRRISVSVKGDFPSFQTVWDRLIAPHIFEKPNLATCFAVTGTIARAVILGVMLGYRKFGFAGIDLGHTDYFWREPNPLNGYVPSVAISSFYDGMSTGAISQGGSKTVPNFFDFLRILKRSHPEIELFTLDPKGRSRVTEFLENSK